MTHIKVQYDAYNRTFKLADRDFWALLEDCALYDLTVPLTFDEIDEIDDFTSCVETPIAHA